ncbi:LysR substrate-binding domain-containing protein [Roseibium sp.]|uniref:LysR substrate-binding domain-containing protein n=1 Tax=Roseibium sp. TaxID=1936156 RepID=UPI003B52472E
MTAGRFDIELLEAFVAVADTGSVTRAGALINRTQPCVSSQLRRLEDRIGRQLIERTSRIMVLTPHGRILYDHAAQILKSHEEARMRLSAPELTGKVHVGLPEWFATSRLQSLFCSFVRVHSNVKLELTVADSATLHERLATNEINLAIALVQSGSAEANACVEELLYWVASLDCVLSDPLPLILFPEPCPFRQFVFTSLEAAGRRWYEQITTTSVAAAQMAILSGTGVGCLPAGAVLDSFKVLKEQAGFPPLPATRLAIYTQAQNSSPIVHHLKTYLEQFLESSVSGQSVLNSSTHPDLRVVQA